MKAVTALIVAAVVGVAVFIAVQFSFVGKDGVKMGVNKASACVEDSPRCLPELTLVDTTGRQWTRDQLAGKVVVVNFWATWCHPCLEEIPALAAVYERHKKEMVLLGVIEEQISDESVRSFADANHMTYPLVVANAAIAQAFGHPSVLPTTFVYDAGGRQRRVEQRGLSEPELEQMVTELIASARTDSQAVH